MTISPEPRRATFVVFEGIDGSGKTTLSNAVANGLRARGLTVEHVREGGTFASSVTQAIRELGRDARNLNLSPRAELLVYLAREVQLVDEATAPALARADVVIADRFFYTAELLATEGRGLPADEVEPCVAAATRGLQPDLVVVVDVDPLVARARRRVSKIGNLDVRPPSRKGLAGVGLQYRLREGYRARAAREPERWIVVENTEADLGALTGALIDSIDALRTGGVAAVHARLPRAPTRAPADTIERAAAAMATWIDERAPREPALAAYLMSGFGGPGWDERRRALADRVPLVVAGGLGRLHDDASWELRRTLQTIAPGAIARSLALALATPTTVEPARVAEAIALVRELVTIVPREVAGMLWGRDDALAWELRAHLRGDELVRSLGGVDGERAWALRDAWLAERGGPGALAAFELAHVLCGSVSGLADERAWTLREAARPAAPVAALSSIYGLTEQRAWWWRGKRVERAPKTVMGTLNLVDDPRAWALRAQVLDRCVEAFDSMRGLDGDDAWQLRARGAARWPSHAVKSLGVLLPTARGRGFLAEQLVRFPDNLGLWRSAALAHTRGAD